MRMEQRLISDAQATRKDVAEQGKDYLDRTVSLNFSSKPERKHRFFTRRRIALLSSVCGVLLLCLTCQIFGVFNALFGETTLTYPTYNTRYNEIDKLQKSETDGISYAIATPIAELLPDVDDVPILRSGSARMDLKCNFLGNIKNVTIYNGYVTNDEGANLYGVCTVKSDDFTIDMYTVYDNSCTVKRGLFSYNIEDVSAKYQDYFTLQNGDTVYFSLSERGANTAVTGVYLHGENYIVVDYCALDGTLPTARLLAEIVCQIVYQ